MYFFFPEISVWIKQINLNFVVVSAGTFKNIYLFIYLCI